MAASTSRKRHASSSVSSTVGDASTECPICLDTMSEPKMLPCGHSLCSTCVDKLAKIGQVVLTGHWIKKYTCPLCKNSTIMEEDAQLPTNYGLKELMGKVKKMRHDEHAKDQLIQQLTGGKSAVECSTCQRKAPSAEAYACLRVECLVHAEWKEDGRPTTNKALLTKTLCSNCVCQQHRVHDITAAHNMASMEDITDAIKTVKAMCSSLAHDLTAISSVGSTKVPFKVFLPMFFDIKNGPHDVLSVLRAPQAPLRKTDLEASRSSVERACQDATKFFESPKWVGAMQVAIKECYLKALTEFGGESVDA